MCSKTVLLLRTKTSGWIVHLEISREEQKEKKREIYVAGRMKKKRLREAEFKMCKFKLVLVWIILFGHHTE